MNLGMAPRRTHFAIGDKVRISGTKSAYNGSVGTICGRFIKSKRRYPVLMSDGKEFNLKPLNIQKNIKKEQTNDSEQKKRKNEMDSEEKSKNMTGSMYQPAKWWSYFCYFIRAMKVLIWTLRWLLMLCWKCLLLVFQFLSRCRDGISDPRSRKANSIWLKPGEFANESELFDLLEPLDHFEIGQNDKNCRNFKWTSGQSSCEIVHGFSSEEVYYIVWDDCFLSTQTEVNMVASYLRGSLIKGNCVIQKSWMLGDSRPKETMISRQEIVELVMARKREKLLESEKMNKIRNYIKYIKYRKMREEDPEIQIQDFYLHQVSEEGSEYNILSWEDCLFDLLAGTTRSLRR